MKPRDSQTKRRREKRKMQARTRHANRGAGSKTQDVLFVLPTVPSLVDGPRSRHDQVAVVVGPVAGLTAWAGHNEALHVVGVLLVCLASLLRSFRVCQLSVVLLPCFCIRQDVVRLSPQPGHPQNQCLPMQATFSRQLSSPISSDRLLHDSQESQSFFCFPRKLSWFTSPLAPQLCEKAYPTSCTSYYISWDGSLPTQSHAAMYPETHMHTDIRTETYPYPSTLRHNETCPPTRS
jgi:hypothetical protein